MASLQALVIALIALIIAPGSVFYFDVTPKTVVLLAGTGVAVAWVAFSGARIAGRPAPAVLFGTLLLLNTASLVLSTALSTRPELSLFGTNWRRYGSVIQAAVWLFAGSIVLSCAGRPDRVRAILRGVTAAGAVSGVYGIAQYFGWDPFLPAAAYHVGEGITTVVRPPGTLGYASYFATWLVFVVFLSLALRTLENSRAARRLAAAATVVAACALLLTGTRAAVLGLIAGALVWMAVRRVRVSRRALLLAGVAVVAGVVFYFAPPGRQLRARARWFADDPWGGARLELWRGSLEMAAHRPAAGYGPEVFTAEFPRYESVKLARAYPDFAHESPHNMFLDALVSQGVPGLLLLLAVCATAFWAAFRARQPALAGALAGGVVSQQFTAFTLPTALIFFVTIGLAVALATPAAAPRRRRPLAAGAVALAAMLVYLAARLWAADHALELAQRELDTGDLRAAVSEYRAYQRLRLPGGSADLWWARAAFHLASESRSAPGRLEAARISGAAAVEATQTAEDPFDAWYNLAVFCGSQNDAACVERSLQVAIVANPMWFKPHWALAEVLRLGGRLESAQLEAARAAELDAGKDPEVVRTLNKIRARRASVSPDHLQK